MSVRSLHVAGDSWLHRLDPVTTIVVALAGVGSVLAAPGLVGNAAVVGVLVLVLLTAGVARHLTKPLVALIPIMLTFLIVQGLVYPGNERVAVTVIGVDLHREGLAVGGLLSLRIAGIVAGMAPLFLTTEPDDLVEALMRRGLSPRMGYVLASVVRIIPTVVDRFDTVRDAQRSRGLRTGGNPVARLRATLALLTPVVTGSLIGTEERALALEVRGFSATGPRTYLRHEVIPATAVPVRVVAVLAFLAVLALRSTLP